MDVPQYNKLEKLWEAMQLKAPFFEGSILHLQNFKKGPPVTHALKRNVLPTLPNNSEVIFFGENDGHLNQIKISVFNF